MTVQEWYERQLAANILLLLLIVAVNVGFAIARAVRVANLPKELEPRPESDPRTNFIAQAQHALVLTYATTGHPFVGFGVPMAHWQFALPLRPERNRPSPDERPDDWPGFDSVALNRHLKSAVLALGQDSRATRRLPGLRVEDQVFVSGRETPFPVHWPGELGEAGLPHATLESVQSDPASPVRHHLKCQVSSWDGELVTTTFLHTAMQGETLYMEFTSFVLPPTKAAYHVFGGDGLSKAAMLATAAVRAAVLTPGTIARSPVEAVRSLTRGVRNAVRRDPMIDRRSNDSGAREGIRELGSDTTVWEHFQSRDAIKYTTILERQILEALTGFLRGKVDISELNGRVETIVNNGVVNYGKMSAGAAGAGSSANVGAVGDSSHGTVQNG